MATKLTAARIATAAGCSTVICLASEPERMTAVMAGNRIGTIFRPHPNPIRCLLGRRLLSWLVSGVRSGMHPGVEPLPTDGKSPDTAQKGLSGTHTAIHDIVWQSVSGELRACTSRDTQRAKNVINTAWLSTR